MAFTITGGPSSLHCGPGKREKQIRQMNIKCLKELSSERPRTNPVGSRVEDLNPRPPDFKSNDLTIWSPPPFEVRSVFQIVAT